MKIFLNFVAAIDFIRRFRGISLVMSLEEEILSLFFQNSTRNTII